jgi:hypothetical protein
MNGEFGFIHNPEATARFDASIPAVYGAQLETLPYNMNQPAIMYRHVAKTLAKNLNLVDPSTRRLRSRHQRNYGSCVGHGGARAALFTASGDIWIRRERESWPLQDGLPADVSPSACYALSKKVGGDSGPGSNGSWMTDALTKMGVPWELKTPEFDLTQYKVEDCGNWEGGRVPNSIVAAASQHPCRSYVRVKTVEQCVALVQNGYGMHMCSTYGWEGDHDEDGFTRINGHWPHCQFLGLCYVVYAKPDGTVKRGIGVQNSWGDNWKTGSPTGSLTPDLPFGSYIIWLADLAKVIANGVVYGIGDYQGFKPAPPNWETVLGW